MKIGVLLYTYNRVDDAKINMEIIRSLWSRNSFLKDMVIVHAYNGQKEWWPEKYLEDELLCLDNPGHFAGAELLINEGFACFKKKYPDITHIVLLAPDTWLLEPEYLERIISSMVKEGKYLATCPWGTKEKNSMWQIGLALDFAVIDFKWADTYQLFPIRYTEFRDRYSEIFDYKNEIIYLERVFALRFKQALARSTVLPSENLSIRVAEQHVFRMIEREPVHTEKTWYGRKKGRRMYFPKIGLITHHDPVEKRKIFRKYVTSLGKYADAYLHSEDLSYYNNGFRKTEYSSNGKVVVSND